MSEPWMSDKQVEKFADPVYARSYFEGLHDDFNDEVRKRAAAEARVEELESRCKNLVDILSTALCNDCAKRVNRRIAAASSPAPVPHAAGEKR